MNFKKYIDFCFGSKKISVFRKLNEIYGKKLSNKILKKTGANNVYHTQKKENSLSLSIKAFKKLYKKNKNIQKIKNLIFVTETPVLQFPGNSFSFASELNLPENIKTLDINSGCTGFVDALNLANSFNGNTLIICSETYSKSIKNFDRVISPIFSDAASVFLLDKNKIKVIDSINGFKKNSHFDLFNFQNSNIKMNGLQVFNFVTAIVAPALKNFINKNIKKKITRIYLHQASSIVLEFFKLKFPKYKLCMPSNLPRRGNSVSATLPILIHDDNYNFNKGDYIVLCGFGVGLSYTISLVKIL